MNGVSLTPDAGFDPKANKIVTIGAPPAHSVQPSRPGPRFPQPDIVDSGGHEQQCLQPACAVATSD